MRTTRRRFLQGTAGAALAGSVHGPAGPARSAPAPGAGTRAGAIDLPARRVPVLVEADVAVCGGGTAGISAAYCAARHGAKVVVLERWPSLGGMATNALVNIWHTSDRRRQVIRGFVQETIERAGEFMHRYADYPRRPETHWFDPEGMRVVFWRMLRDRGVRVLCNVSAVESVIDAGRMRAVLVDTKTGRKAVCAKVFLDATGDGDVAAHAGLPFDLGRPADGRVQGMTMMFELRGVQSAQARSEPAERARDIVARMRALRDQGRFPPFNERHALHYLRAGTNGLYNMCPASGNPLDEEELTRLSAEARAHVFEYRDFWRREAPGFAEAELVQMGFSLGIRESRRIRGLKTLDGRSVVGAVKQPDAVGHGFWMIDIHDPTGTGYTTHSDQAPDLMPPVGESYHIPLGMCLNATIPNLAVVGRCASSTHEGLASVRLQSHCMVMGQGVGTCAALALQAGVDMARLDIRTLQTQLRKDGVHLEDVPESERNQGT